ncbi:protein containing conserved repeat domain [Bellilinea caldifistulae]|uniref:DUF11 domain-containing protein n=1 Tax=Bellilinea caldifistulae TaxID=360411 RepID=A0A0P6XC93_9CHLR|nr:right-handed parallel beta-helix repeat-containing protein [Bellilinea caldifistulae]KPL72467.1 hypothetical protein AC812_15765 [Bellilinea caldifistulae]GAP10825.1 protein containing conserved repeat domain [Bellilinea caldifistulae]
MKTFRILIQLCLIFGLIAGLWAVIPAVQPVSADDPTTITVCSSSSSCDYTTIQAAVNAASPGDVIEIKNGTYTSSTINISKPLTIKGESKEGVLIQAGSSNGYGLYIWLDPILDIQEDYFTIQNVTVENYNGAFYGLKISGKANVTIENVEVRNYVRSGIDLIGVEDATLENINSHDNGGVGIAVSNSQNITLSDITTSSNGWGGIGLFTNNTYYTANLSDGKTGIDGVTLTGTNSFGELNPLYMDFADSSHVIRNFTQNEFAYVVRSTAASQYIYYQKTKQSALGLINADPVTFKPTAAIQQLSDGSFHVLDTMKIQSAIDLAEAGGIIYIEPGVYTENITINKQIRLNGAGSGENSNSNTILRKNTNAAVVTLAASGTQGSPILLKDFRIEPVGVYGINVPSGTVEYVSLENIKVIGSKPANDTESEVGLKVATSASLQNITVEGSSFDQLHYGWYFAKHGDWTSGSSNVENVVVVNTTFNENSSKGIYVEKLSNATFTNVLVEDNGWNTLFFNAQWNAGIDINLKGEAGGKTYQNLIFNNLTVKNNAKGTKNGAGVMIKARDDGSTYSLYPATLTNVQINGGIFEGNERGIRFGEPEKNNAGPSNVVIQNAIIRNNTKSYTGNDGSAYGGVINYTQQQVKAENNYWGTLSWAGYGSVSGIQTMVYGNVDWQPWRDEALTQSLNIPTITYADDDNAGKAEGDLGANGGTFGYNAFATIEDALNHVAPGGTVIVGAGNYSGDIQINKAVTLTGQNRPVLDGRFWVNTNNVVIQGFEIQNGRASTGVEQSGVYISGAQNVIIRDNHLIGTWNGEETSFVGGRGILTSGNVSGLLVDGNEIEKWVSGLYLNPTSGSITVINNEIHDNWAGAGTDGQTNVTFRNNYFSDNIEGIGASSVGASFVVEENAFLDNTTAVKWYSGAQIKAERNWWAHPSGPANAGNPGGSGQPVVGSVDFIPWLCDGTDSQPSAIGFQPATGAATCTATSEATRLVFVSYPTVAYENVPFATQPVVRAEDDDGNLAVNFNGVVILYLANNPAGGALQGTLLVNAVNGVATFSGVSISKAGQNYRLAAIATSLDPAVGGLFDVLPQNADLAVSISASPNPVETGAALTYTVGVQNLGPLAASNLTLTVNLPGGVNFVNAGGTGWTCSQSAGVVTCTRFSLAATSSAPDVTITVNAPNQAGSITATASISSETLDLVAGNDQASANTLVVTIPETGGITIYLPLVKK